MFKQNPDKIAHLFTSVLDEPEFKGRFKKLFFAVLGDENYNAFATAMY